MCHLPASRPLRRLRGESGLLDFGFPSDFRTYKALEFAGVLTWQNRITRIRERCRDLFGHDGWRWRVIRTSNAYVFCDPKPQPVGLPA